MTSAPASTVGEIREVLKDYDATRDRSRQTNLGPSELGTPCRRQIAMKLAGVPKKREDKVPWAPLQGSAVHVLQQDVLAFHNAKLGRDRWVIEQRVDLDGELSGTGDAYDQDNNLIIDWKHAGVTTLKAAKRESLPPHERIRPEYAVQAMLYGLGHERAGRKVDWVRIVFLARTHDFDDSTEVTLPYKPAVAEWALKRYYAVRDLVVDRDMAVHPERLGEIPAAPTAGICKWCPFKRPGPEVDATGCQGYVSDLDRPVNDWLASLPAA